MEELNILFLVFIQNMTLLVAAIVVYTMIIRRWDKGSLQYSLGSGLLFGIVAILGMRMPFVLQPGVIFDGRSIILSIAGLFGGPLTALIAAVISAVHRVYIGGAGMYVGVATIILSAAFGAAYYYLLRRTKKIMTPVSLIIFSLLLNLLTLFMFTYIPGLSAAIVINQLALPILLLYPPATVVIAYVISAQETRLNTEKKLLESEQRLRKTQEIANIGSWELDLLSEQLYWSPETYEIFGVKAGEFIPSYKSFLQLIHPDDRDRVDQAYSNSIESGLDHYEIEHQIVHPEDQDVRHVHERCEHYKNRAGQVIRSVGMVQDITERKLYESKLKYLSLHDQLTDLYNRTYFEEELKRLNKSREYPITIISADLDGLKLINDTLGHYEGDKMLIACAKILKSSLRQSDLLSRIGGDEFAAILPRTDAETGEIVYGRIKDKIDEFNQSNASLPLSISLGIATAKNPDHESLFDLLKTADDYMYREKLYHRSSNRNQVVHALMVALSERDFIAEGHADRVQELCNKMGVRAGLNSRQLSDLALLAQVHDLGKVGIPDQILFKPGPLDEEEWIVMKMHPEKGYRIASASPDLAVVAELILKHHEHYDGSGYPMGLAGEEIPVECRILSIVDAYDAMTNNRPYSKAKSGEEAITEIKKFTGSQFDPLLVEIFVDIIN